MAATLTTGGDALAPPLYSSTATWFTSSVAMLISVIVHTAALIVFALVSLNRHSSHEEGGEGRMETEVAIGSLAVENLSVRPAEHFDESKIVGGERDDDQLDATIEIFAEVRSPVANEFAVDELASPLASSGGGRSAALGDLGSTPIVVGGRQGEGQATFMGVQAVGERFCIVADRSGSMFGSKFDFLKAEILRTVAGMSPHARLQLVLFSERALPYPKTEWLQPNKERLAIETWLRGIVADGDTYPRPALNLAFDFDPPPDAIFFMTDGQFDPQVVYQLRRLQRVSQKQVKVHTITFVDRSSERMMRLIATENGGTYRHVADIADVEE